jgi:hypothetical protein
VHWQVEPRRSDAFSPPQRVGASIAAREAVQASGVIYAKDKVDLVRAILAKHIIAAAKDGERDHSRLRDGALLALAKSNLRSTLPIAGFVIPHANLDLSR